MKKIIYTMPLCLFILLGGMMNTFAEEVSADDMEEVLIAQFHKQLSQSIKQAYNIRFPQFEKAHILSIKKTAFPEPSEEMKPGTEYEIVIKVEVLNVPQKTNSLIITLANSESRGEFTVKEVKKAA